MFIDNINSINFPSEKVIELVNELFNISKAESIPLDQVSAYIKQKLEYKQKLDEEIKHTDDILQGKNVNIDTPVGAACMCIHWKWKKQKYHWRMMDHVQFS